MEGNRDIVVISGSAGAIDAICTILDGLPSDVNAAVFLVRPWEMHGGSRRAEPQ